MRISITASFTTRACSVGWYKLSLISSMALLLTGLTTLSHAATDIPSKGMTQSQVRSNFGEPKSTEPPVGKPPISRWDYENYSVYFENKYVIHSFQHDQKLRPKPSSSPANKQSEQGASQAAPPMPAKQGSEPQVNEETEPQVNEETEQPDQEKQASQQQIEEEIEQEMQAAAAEEKDLNFEEDPESADYGKWAN